MSADEKPEWAVRLRPESTDLRYIYRRLVKNAGLLLGGALGASLITFVALALNARALGPEGLGVIALLQAFAAVLTGIFSVGTQQPLIRLGMIAIERNEPVRLGSITALALVFDIAAAVLAGVVGLLVALTAVRLIGLKPTQADLAVIYTLSIFFNTQGTSTGLLRLLNKFSYMSLIQVGGAFAYLCASAVFYLLSAPLSWYVVAVTLIAALTSQTQLWLSLALLGRCGVRLCFDLKEFRTSGILHEFTAYSWMTSVNGTIDALRVNGDTLFLGAILGSTAVGVYNVAKQIAGILRKFSMTIQAAIFPEAARLAAKHDFASARIVLIYLVTIGGIITLVGLVVVVLVGEPFLRTVFGIVFAEGHVALLILTFTAGLTMVSSSLACFVQAFRGPVTQLVVYAIAFALYCVMAPLAMIYLGLSGAALGQLAFTVVVTAGCAWVLWCALRPEASLAKPLISDGPTRSKG